MPVNKSQGQTIPNVGVYLPAPVFSHGQLYVAMSSATARTNIKILALPPNAEAEQEQARRQEEKDEKRQRARVKNDVVKKTKESPASEWHI
jgi:ATP-dependent DNA helicase PIF1